MALNGPDDPRHGTLNGYSNHRCRCEACKETWRDYCLQKRKRRFDLGAKYPQMIPHGTTGGYGNWRCRCEECTAAWNKDGRERVARKRMEEAERDPIHLINALAKIRQ